MKARLFLRQVDAFCARLNPGLAAVSLVLSVVVAAEISVKLPALLEEASARAAQAALAGGATALP